MQQMLFEVSEPQVKYTYDKWECFRAGLYSLNCEYEGKELAYPEVLGNLDTFAKALRVIVNTWPNSCEHYLTNTSVNRIAWLGQAAVCVSTGVPMKYRTGWSLLSKEKQDAADAMALFWLNRWLVGTGRRPVLMVEAKGG